MVHSISILQADNRKMEVFMSSFHSRQTCEISNAHVGINEKNRIKFSKIRKSILKSTIKNSPVKRACFHLSKHALTNI